MKLAYPLNAPNRKICGFAANFSEKRKGASRPCSALRALRAETVILAYLETVMVAFMKHVTMFLTRL